MVSRMRFRLPRLLESVQPRVRSYPRKTRGESLGEWILSCAGIEGVTFSGGEPFQQAPSFALLQPSTSNRGGRTLSIGVFTGYALNDLARGRWHWRAPDGDVWVKGDTRMFDQITQFLDFGVFGRFRQSMA